MSIFDKCLGNFKKNSCHINSRIDKLRTIGQWKSVSNLWWNEALIKVAPAESISSKELSA